MQTEKPERLIARQFAKKLDEDQLREVQGGCGNAFHPDPTGTCTIGGDSDGDGVPV